MTAPLVSIIVPTYNRPALLYRALKSIAEQTFQNYEVIVINDGGQYVENVTMRFIKTRCITLPENRGLPAARNAGIERAQGAWIAYLDDDDWYYPDHLMTLLKKRTKTRFVYSDADAIRRDGGKQLYMSIDFDPVRILTHNITPVCCVLHDRQLFGEVGMFDEDLPNHEDWDLWIRMSKVVEMYHIKEVTCCIDRSRPTMNSDIDAMKRGYDLIRERYAAPDDESITILPA